MELLHAIVLAIVEGLTEYLPVSSTGHIILTSYLFGIQDQSFVKDYTVIVQFGAIMSVLVLYRARFLQSLEIYKKLFVGFLPAAIIGLLLKDNIDQILGSVSVVAWALIIGGVILIILDRKSPKNAGTTEVTYRQAVLIGLAQCLAFVPGVSRSAASIIGGIWQGLDRKTAAEFSFLLAVPTLAGATGIKLIKLAPAITAEQIYILLLGNVISFVVGLLAIRAFIHYLTRFGFDKFGWYRILVGITFLFLMYLGHGLAAYSTMESN